MALDIVIEIFGFGKTQQMQSDNNWINDTF